MNAIAIGAIVFACAFGGAVLGIFLSAVLPKHHLTNDSKDVIKVSVAMVATLAALVVGLLIASARSSFDSKDGEMRGAAAHAILLDRTMAEYGLETAEIRDLFRQIVVMKINQVWPAESTGNVNPDAIGRGRGIEIVQGKLLDLVPQDDAQRWLKSTALQLNGNIAEARWLVVEQTDSSIHWPFLAILAFWLTIIFASFGLFAPCNASVLAALFVCALSVGGSIYLIVEMDQPYGGLIKISSAPFRAVLDQLGRQ